MIMSASMVIISRNPLYSILFLICSFFSASMLLFLFDNEFLALFFLIIYLGAIAILFLFVIMMLNIKFNELQISKIYLPAGILIGFLIFFETYTAFSKTFPEKNYFVVSSNCYLNWYDNLDSLSDFYIIGQIFYSYFVIQILIAGLILFVAIIGVAFLTVKPANPKIKTQSVLKQLSRTNFL